MRAGLPIDGRQFHTYGCAKDLLNLLVYASMVPGNRYMLKVAGSAISGIFFLVAGADAALLLDQDSNPPLMGAYGDPVIQSFMPSVNNVAGVNVQISGTAALVEDVTVNLYGDYDASSNSPAGLLASDTIADHPRNTVAQFRFAPVAVQPEVTYYLEFVTGQLGVGAGISNSTDYYDRGEILAGGGNLAFTYKDANFETLYDTSFSAVPLPAGGALLLGALSVFGLARRRFGLP